MPENVVYTACPGWGDHEYCTIKTVVEDGQILRTERATYTGPEANCAIICQKGLAAGRIPYLEGRLKYPLKRAGERGEGKWERISWDQAFDEIGEKINKMSRQYGPESLAVWSLPAGNPPTMGLDTLLTQRFLSLFGPTDPIQGIALDNAAGFAGWLYFGSGMAYQSIDPRLIEQSKYVVVWGANPLENQHRITRHIIEAKVKGAKLVDIGIIFDATAAKSDWFIPVKPGSDAALALAMANVIVSKEFYDRDFLLKRTTAPFLVDIESGKLIRDDEGNFAVWCNLSQQAVPVAPKGEIIAKQPALEGTFDIFGITCKPVFELLKEHLKNYTPQSQEALTGVPASDVEQLAREYATTKPAFIVGAYGIRYMNQGDIYRALYLLGALTGNLGKEGGGVTEGLLPTGHTIVYNILEIAFPGFPEPPKAKLVWSSDFFEQVKSGKPYPIKGLIKAAGNPLHNYPNRGRWVNEVFPNMDLIVDYDIWMTDTGEMADYVLPACSSFERDEIVYPGCYNHIILQEAAVKPPGEAKAPAEFWHGLANRLGLGEYFNHTTDEWLSILLNSEHPTVAGVDPPVTLERLRREKVIRANVPETLFDPFASEHFLTTSGRMEIYSEDFADLNEAFPIYAPPGEVSNIERSKTYPFQFFSGRQRFFMQSQFTDDPWMIELAGGRPSARMNPKDAKKLGIQDGDMIECFNERGRVKAPVRLNEAVPPGTVQVWFGWRRRQFDDGTYAELIQPIGAAQLMDNVAKRWRELVIERGQVTPFMFGAESMLAGAWDILWDCTCTVKKL